MKQAAKLSAWVLSLGVSFAGAGCGMFESAEDAKDKSKDKDEAADVSADKDVKPEDFARPGSSEGDRPVRNTHKERVPAAPPEPGEASVRLSLIRKHLDVTDEHRQRLDGLVREHDAKQLLPELQEMQERLSQIQGTRSGHAGFDSCVGKMLSEVHGMMSSVKAGDWAKVEDRKESVHACGSACNALLADAMVKAAAPPAEPARP